MGGGFIDDDKWDRITDPGGLFGGRAGSWADPLGVIGRSTAETAEQRAARLEAERQENIRRTSAEVERIYGSPERQQQYTDLYNASRDLGMADLNKQKAIADRQAKFGLARGGLTGGSRAIDLGSQLGSEYTDGLLTVDQRALAAKADLMGADQQCRSILPHLQAAVIPRHPHIDRILHLMDRRLGDADTASIREPKAEMLSLDRVLQPGNIHLQNMRRRKTVQRQRHSAAGDDDSSLIVDASQR